MDSEIKIFSGSSGKTFAEKICAYLNIQLGQSEVIRFSEGNLFVRINENVRNQDVYLVQSIALNPNEEFVEILFWMDAFKRASANSVTAIIPYFGYAKGDKKDEPRVSIRARVCAECVGNAGADRIVTMDLPSPQIQGFFKKPVDHLYALPVLCEYIKRQHLEDFVVVSPDAGFAKQAKKYASYLKVSVAIGDKVRSNHHETAEVADVIGKVRGKNALIVDDFAISGSTLIDLAKTLRKRGVRKIYAYLSHILLTMGSIKKFSLSPIVELTGTDSVDNIFLKKTSKIKIISIAPLFAEAILRIHERQSVSSLFEKIPDKVLSSCLAEGMVHHV